MISTRTGERLADVLTFLTCFALAVSAVLWWVFRDVGATTVTAYFDEAVGVYSGSDLRVLGVRVGTVDSVVPVGGQVRVRMTVDHDVVLPAGVRAVEVAPSVVSDRYVQLTPVYRGGPRLVDGAVIPASRTATPVELDQLYASLSQLATELGPAGANANGALSDLLNTGANNLNGNGTALNDTIQQFGAATRTLAGSSDNLFATVDNLRMFTTMLKNNDGQVRTALQQLDQVAGFLAADRQDLAGALNGLATALAQVQGFIQDNRDHLKSNVDKLAAISQILVNQRQSLAEALDVAPLAVTNLVEAYDPSQRTLDSRANLTELAPTTPGASLPTPSLSASAPVCALAGNGSALSSLCQQSPSLSGGLVVLSPAQQRSSVALPLPMVGPVYGTPRSGGN